MSLNIVIRVAVGIIANTKDEYLVAKRDKHKHQGDLWEFPGGKLEPDEDVYAALCRELHEELGITVRQAHALDDVRYDYEDRHVVLHVWRVTQYEGEPRGRESQPLQWVSKEHLKTIDMPAANVDICRMILNTTKI